MLYITKEDYIMFRKRSLIDKLYDGSTKNFVAAGRQVICRGANRRFTGFSDAVSEIRSTISYMDFIGTIEASDTGVLPNGGGE